MASVVSRANGRKFREVAAEEVDIDGDLLEQLREAIRYNQTVKALICIELLFEKMDNVDDEVGMDKSVVEEKKTTTTATKKATKAKATAETKEKEDDKD